MRFEWNQDKNILNLLKDGVDFEESMSVFDDGFALIIEDHAHSSFERREIIVGQSSENRLLYVVFSERGNGIRIISARKLTSAEKRRYEKGKFDG